ncbi:TPA: right-handed parallel beta-helix repeat-containing protein [Klebsiella pneumoniae]|nr:right-handed parallel beta-helix repeat-containing protein [Klebsiella pneumoniae]
MSTYKTKNPLGSAAVKDLYDNAENVDKFVNDRTKEELEDRLGVLRKTWHGMEMIFSRFIDYITGRGEQAVAAIGWQELGNWAVGLAVDNRQQIVYYNGSWYKYLGELEHVIAGDSPENDGGVWSAANPTGKWSNIGDAALRSNLGSSDEGLGADLVNTVLDISVGKYIQNASPRISDYKVTKGADATLAFAKAFDKAAETTGVVIVDVSCVIDTIAVPPGITIRIADYKTITQKANASAHMFILPSNSLIKANNKKGRLRGNSFNQSSIRRCISAVGVTDAGVDGIDIRDFNSYGAYFESCEDTFCKNSTIRDITGGAVETAAGQYVTNCLRHESAFNDIRDTGSNGIKFRADTLGQTQGCSSTNDKVYRAGFIGIANGKCKDHTVTNAYCESCVDNGCDMNGCYNTRFIDCVSVGCQDGFYMGENGIDNCHIINPTARNCKRSGVGSLGSLTRCSVINPTIDACGSGIYCSGFVGFKIRDGSITNSVKQTYTDNETGTVKTSTGNGIDLQSNLSGCYQPDISGTTFYGNAGYDIAFGSSGTIGNLMLGECSFQDSAGDGKISYGGATLADPQIRNSQGYIVSRTQVYNLAGDGTTLDFTLSLPQAVADANYRIVSVVPDWLTTIRYLDNTKGTSYFIISFGTAPTSGTRRLNVTFERLRPAH